MNEHRPDPSFGPATGRPTKRCAVIGLYSSGSSLLSGILHRLGVNMGRPFQGNKYEPADLARYLRYCWNEPDICEVVPKDKRVEELAKWMQRQETQEHGFTGAKHPLLCLSTQDLIEAWGEKTYFIRAFRPLDESIASLQIRRWPAFVGKEEIVQKRLWEASDTFFARKSHLQICFGDVLSNPALQIGRMIEYLGLKPSPEAVAQAVLFVQLK